MTENDFYYDKTLIVFLRDEEVIGSVVNLGAHASIVKYQWGGMEFEELRENEDFVIIDTILIKHYLEEE